MVRSVREEPCGRQDRSLHFESLRRTDVQDFVFKATDCSRIAGHIEVFMADVFVAGGTDAAELNHAFPDALLDANCAFDTARCLADKIKAGKYTVCNWLELARERSTDAILGEEHQLVMQELQLGRLPDIGVQAIPIEDVNSLAQQHRLRNLLNMPGMQADQPTERGTDEHTNRGQNAERQPEAQTDTET